MFLGSFGGLACRQPPPANPFSKPLIEVLGINKIFTGFKRESSVVESLVRKGSLGGP